MDRWTDAYHSFQENDGIDLSCGNGKHGGHSRKLPVGKLATLGEAAGNFLSNWRSNASGKQIDPVLPIT